MTTQTQPPALTGYSIGAPSADVAALDRPICTESECSDCGHVGMDYRPIHKGDSYRAFAVCPECGNTEEF